MSDFWSSFSQSFNSEEDEIEENVEPELEDPPGSDQDIEVSLTEAERRLRKARYYESMLQSDIFNDPSMEAEEVQEEFRKFARWRMNILLGVIKETSPEPVNTSVFSDEDVKILKMMVDKVRQATGATTVTVQPVSVPQTPKVQVKAPPKPVVAKSKTPQPLKKAPAPAPKPGGKPSKAPAKPKAKPASPSTPAPEPGPLWENPPRYVNGELDEDKIPVGQVFLDSDGKKYKFVANPVATNQDHPEYDPTQPQKRKMLVNTQAIPPTRIPMPDQNALAYISHASSANQIESARGNQLLINAAAGSLAKK